jgi:dTDP-4-dehydrorhamnose reductase
MKKAWVIGATGQLGFHLGERLGMNGVPITHAHLDLTKTSGIAKFFDNQVLESEEPSVVFNATAYNKVDQAEKEQNLCDLMNVEAPRAMANWCSTRLIPFVHFSTDYVYSGSGVQPWQESDVNEPLCYYGRSKLKGERAVLEEWPSALVFRTSWVYSHRRENFMLTILKNAREKGEVSVVTDLIGHPTYADALAETVLKISRHPEFESREAGGVYNLSDSGEVTRFDFAQAILEEAEEYEKELSGVKMKQVLSTDFASAAKRPANTRMSLDKVRRTFGVQPAPWRENLKICMRRYYASR